MKTCSKCKKQKDQSEFQVNNAALDGLRTDCRECRKAPCKEYYDKNCERYNEYHRQYYRNHTDDCVKNGKEWRNQLKIETFTHFGIKCEVCGETDLDLLTLAHINGDGREHRNELYGNHKSSGHKLYSALRQLDWDTGKYDIQVLCRSCHPC